LAVLERRQAQAALTLASRLSFFTTRDLGLAYLLCGDENAGLNWLHNAQQEFRSAGQTDQLAQCLKNEAGYLEQVKKGDRAKEVRGRLASLRAE
jgi:hypothetical protein